MKRTQVQNKDKILKIIISLILIIFVILPIIVESPYLRHVFIFILIYIALGSSWNIIGGYAGQWSLGHAAFFGIGAYTSTLLLLHLNLTPWVGIFIGGVAATIVSFIIGFPCFKLRTHYFAIATLAFGEIMRLLFLWFPFTGGSMGLLLPIVKIPSAYYMLWANKLPYYYICLFLVIGIVWLTYKIDQSRLGMYLKAVKQDEDAAKNLGINVTKYKVLAMGISSFLTAMMGTIYAQYIQFIDPVTVMPFILSLYMILIPIFGGLGTVFGPLLGAVILVSIEEITRVLFGGMGIGIDLMFYGLVIIILSLYFPKGLIGYIKVLRTA